MPKFFVVSDVHGFYDELLNTLDDAGFDPENTDHYLISCGDNFDRGPQNLEVQKFFIRAPRTILIRGNHEDLFDWAVRDGFTMRDIQNGTYQTIQELKFLSISGLLRMKLQNMLIAQLAAFSTAWLIISRLKIIFSLMVGSLVI